MSTDRLIDDLWAGDPPPKALGALQAHVSYLRRSIEPDRPRRVAPTVLVSDAPGYALRLDPSAVDAWRFERLLADADRADPVERHCFLTAALSCWRGDPYAAFADAEWVQAEAARLTELHHLARERHAQACLDLGNPDEALATLHRHAAEHPDRENAARLLALTQYRLGRQLDALATLRRVNTYLDAEFGVLPGPALRALETAILSHAPELDYQPLNRRDAPTAPDAIDGHEASDSRGIAAEPESVDDRSGPSDDAGTARSIRNATALVGYARERAALPAEAAHALADRRARVVWIEGEAGAGKTTLADSAVAELAAEGWTVARAACPEVEGAPAAWAWVEVAEALAADPAEFEQAGGGLAGPFTIAQAVRRGCESRGGPVVLVLEDVHRADSATLQILRQVVAWLAERSVLIVVTLRGSEADEQVRATAAALTSVTGQRIELGGLDVAAVRAVAAAVGLAEIDEAAAEQLRVRTGGNPLFVREVAKLAAAIGDMHAVPDSVRDVLSRRVARLPAGASRALRLAAVWGEDIDFDALLELTGETEDALVDLIDTVAVAGLVRVDGSGRIGFTHALIRDAVYGAIPALRRGRLHWATLELLERRSGLSASAAECALRRVDLDALAHHAIEGATTPTAAHALHYVLAAARECTARRAHQDAAPLWHSALELHTRAGHQSPNATESDRLAMLATRCALVNALAYGGNDAAARALRIEALELARTLTPGATRIPSTVDPIVTVLTSWRAPTIWTSRNRGLPDPRLWADMAAAVARTTDPGLRIRLLVTTVFEVEGIDVTRAYESSAEALRLARELGDPELLCAALNARAFVSLGPDFWSHRADLASELLRVARAAELLEYEAVAHFLLFLVASGAGALIESRVHIHRALDCAAGGQLGPLLVVSTAHLAVLAILRGDYEAATAINADLSAEMVAAGHANGAEVALLADMMTGWAHGDLSAGLSRYAEVYAVAPYAIAHVYVLALLDAGETERAAEVFAADHAVLRDYYWLGMSAFKARAAIHFGATEQVHQLYRDLLPRAGTIAGLDSGSVAFGPVDNVLAELAHALGDPSSAQRHRADADIVRARIAAELAALDRAEAGRAR